MFNKIEMRVPQLYEGIIAIICGHEYATNGFWFCQPYFKCHVSLPISLGPPLCELFFLDFMIEDFPFSKQGYILMFFKITIVYSLFIF